MVDWMDDIQVPLIFIRDYLPRLSAAAVQVYLLALAARQRGLGLDCASLEEQLAQGEEVFLQAAEELARMGLLDPLRSSEALELTELKAQYLAQHYEARLCPEQPEQAVEELSEDQRLRALLLQIQQTFYPNNAEFSLLRLVDSCWNEYHFDESVIYMLFSEAAAQHKLHSRNYIRSIASHWHEEGVRSYEDLLRYQQEREELERLARELSRKLGYRQFTEADRRILHRWLFTYHFGRELIDEALERSVHKGDVPGLSYFDSILRAWYEAGLRDLDAVRAWEEQRRLKRKSGTSGRQRAARRVDFEDHHYNEDFYERMNVNLEDYADAD